MDQAERLRQMVSGAQPTPRPSSGPRVLVVTSGKGGVGKTTIAANLALVFASEGIRTGLVDADLGLSGVDVMLGLTPKYHLGHVLEGSRTLDEVAVEASDGLLVYPGGQGWRSLADASDTDLLRLTGGLQSLASKPRLLVVDTSPGITRNVSAFARLGDLALVVTTADPTSQADAYASIKTLHQDRPDRPLRLLVNQVSGPAESIRVEDGLASVTQRFLGIKVPALGFVPDDSAVSRSLQLQKALSLVFPQSPSAVALRSLARRLARELLDSSVRSPNAEAAASASQAAPTEYL
ncbi:MAG TPA: P-loop NTPase [Armatimonadota bacterium]|jgi:flagellar biosynthesis protein FlhG